MKFESFSEKRKSKITQRILAVRDKNIARRVEEQRLRDEQVRLAKEAKLRKKPYKLSSLVFLRYVFSKRNQRLRKCFKLLRFLVWFHRYTRRYKIKFLKTKSRLTRTLRLKGSRLVKIKPIQGHGFHLVNVSPWPVIISFSLLGVVMNLGMYFHKVPSSLTLFCFSLFNLIYFLYFWFKDIVIESTYEGHHTQLVQKGIKLGMILFILSEVMFFFAFFWGFFHSSLSPAIQLGGIWPPTGITPFDPWDVPFLNTVILLTSGITVTWVHFAVGSKLKRSFHRRSILKNMLLKSNFEKLLKRSATISLTNERLLSRRNFRMYWPRSKKKLKHLYPLITDKLKRGFITYEYPHNYADPFGYYFDTYADLRLKRPHYVIDEYVDMTYRTTIAGVKSDPVDDTEYNERVEFRKRRATYVGATELGIFDYYFRRDYCENFDDASFELFFSYRIKRNLRYFFSEFEYMDARVFYFEWLRQYTLDFIKYGHYWSLIWYRLGGLRMPYKQEFLIFAHNSFLETALGLASTIGLGILFTGLQACEYLNSPFTISDGAYGSTFFLTTGFHGLHVLIGTAFLGVCYKRLLQRHFTKRHHVGLECAIWYWHFVDVVWLGVYLSIYHWGSAL